MNFKALAGAIAVAASLAASSAAHAVTILTWTNGNVGVTKTLDFNGFEDSVIAGLSAEIDYKLTAINNGGKSWVFNYQIDNTSTAPTTASRISGFGFNVDPNVSSVSATGVLNHTATNGNVPMIGTREVCITGNNCAGGGGSGVTFGNTGLGTFTLNFSSAKTSLSLSDFYVRYQAVNAPGFSNGSAVGTVVDKVKGGVPEPATWAMMMVGFFAIGSALRSSRRRLALAA